jgi:hypothetical protein
MSKQKYLVSFSADYADEFEIEAIKIMSEKKYQKLEKNMKKKGPFYISFGTNESIFFENGESFLNCLSFKPVSKKEAKVLKKYLSEGVGFVNFLD